MAKKFCAMFLPWVLIAGCAYGKSIDDGEIEDLMRKNNVPGLSMVIIENGAVILDKAYLQALPDHVFEAASLSKPLFAYGVLKMVDRGKLDLDRPLAEYLVHTDIKDDPRTGKITARMVLTHSAGLPNGKPQNQQMQIAHEPGSKFSYSGQGFVYLQKVIEHLSNMSLEEYMQTNVLTPLRMKSSSYIWQDSYDKTKIKGYNADGVQVPGIKPKSGVASYTLHTTSSDYAKFLIAVIRGTGLKNKTKEEMLTSSIEVDESGPICSNTCSGKNSRDVSWGLGFGIQKTERAMYFWHWGVNDGFRSYVAGSSSGRSVVIFTNSSNGLKIIPRIAELATGVEHPAFYWLDH